MKKWWIYASCVMLGLTMLAPVPAQAKNKKGQNLSVSEYQKKSAKDKKKADKKARKEQHKADKQAKKSQKNW